MAATLTEHFTNLTGKIIGQCFCYIIALAMCWVLVGQFVQYDMSISKLNKIEGLVDTTLEVAKRRLKSNRKDYELRIFLKDKAEYFRFMDIYKYQNFRGQIHNGDTAQIYIRPKWLVLFGMGHRNDIFQMSINGKTIFDISKTRKNTGGIIILAFFAIPFFILLGLYIRRKK